MVVSPLTRLALFNSEGHITHGSFLDIEVGDSSESAADAMKRHEFKLVRVSAGGECMGVIHSISNHVELYFDDSWRRGTICLVSKKGRIVAIDWFYNFMAP
jgi:hypothetical protein